jgi:hypothetical protein
VHVVPLAWDGTPGCEEQRDGARQVAGLLYMRMTTGDPVAQSLVYRFLDAWREYVRLSMEGCAFGDTPLLTGEPLTLHGDDVFEHWHVVQEVLLRVWPDVTERAATASRALIRLKAAFDYYSDHVDVAAVHREMLTVAAFVEDIEARMRTQPGFAEYRSAEG